MSAKRVLVLNGPNLNLLGTREPEIYGRMTLAELDALCVAEGERLGLDVTCRQSNHEGELIAAVHATRGAAEGLLVNAGAYSHTSIALQDALRAFSGPIVEVHLSNIHRREPFRHHSFVAEAATAVVCGLGPEGYRLGLAGLARLLETGA